MYHIVFSPLLDTNRSEKPVIGVFCRCLWAFPASTHRLGFLSSYLCLKELYISPWFRWSEPAKMEPFRFLKKIKKYPEMKNAEEFLLFIAGGAETPAERCISALWSASD